VLRLLGRVNGGVSDGIEVVDLQKHWGIDPARFPPHELTRLTNPKRFGSKWLSTLTSPVKFEMIRQVLDANEATVSLAGSPRLYRSQPQTEPIGIVNGQPVKTFIVSFDGRRWAHAYPSDPG
jgi:hypothetical protein